MTISGKLDTQRLLGGAAILGALAVVWAIERPSRRGRSQPSDTALQDMDANGNARWDSDDAASSALPPQAWSWPWWKHVLLTTYRDMGENRLVAVAAGVVFYALLAIFPTITAFVSFYGLFADPATIGRHLGLLANVLPAGGLDIVTEQVTRIASRPGELSFGFVAGLAVALWSANAGVKAVIDALNVVEERDEARSFVRLNALSLTFTVGAILFLLVAVGAVVAFPLAMSAFGLADTVGFSTGFVRWPLLLALAVFAIAVLYRFGPSGKRRSERFITVGVVFAALAWLAGSVLLSFYMSNFADYNATYGSLGAAIGLMIWMWLSACAILIGAEIDVAICKQMQSRDERLEYSA